MVGPVTAAALETGTFVGTQHIAHAKVAGVSLGGALGVSATVLRARATAMTCHTGPAYGGFSEVANLVIGSNPPITGSAPVDIPLGPFVTVHVNETVAGPNEVVHRAVRIEFLVGPDIVFAEARAGCPPVD